VASGEPRNDVFRQEQFLMVSRSLKSNGTALCKSTFNVLTDVINEIAVIIFYQYINGCMYLLGDHAQYGVSVGYNMLTHD